MIKSGDEVFWDTFEFASIPIPTRKRVLVIGIRGLVCKIKVDGVEKDVDLTDIKEIENNGQIERG